MKKYLVISLVLGLVSCSLHDKKTKEAWIKNLTAKPLYGKTDGKAIIVDKSSGDFLYEDTVNGTTTKVNYKFNEAVSETRAIYTENQGSYKGFILVTDGMKSAKFVDAVTTPSRQKGNIDWNVAPYDFAVYTKPTTP